MFNQAENTPIDVNRENLKTARMNKERVCQKRIKVKKKLEELMFKREIKEIMEA